MWILIPIQLFTLMRIHADPDPALFVSDLQDANNKLFFLKYFWLITFGRYTYIILRRWNVMKKSQNSRNKGFSCLMLETPGSGTGFVSLTNGSGSGRPKNLRIRNTNSNMVYKSSCYVGYSREMKTLTLGHLWVKVWKKRSDRDSPRAPRRDGWKESSILPSGTRPSPQRGSSPNQPGNPSGPLLNNKQFHII